MRVVESVFIVNLGVQSLFFRSCSLMYVVLECGQFYFVAKCLRCAPYAYGRILFAVTRRVPLVFL
jgi:hypothetical protein